MFYESQKYKKKIETTMLLIVSNFNYTLIIDMLILLLNKY